MKSGALVGAVHGIEAVPQRWIDAIVECRPQAGDPRVQRPRPVEYWPTDALVLPAALLNPAKPPELH